MPAAVAALLDAFVFGTDDGLGVSVTPPAFTAVEDSERSFTLHSLPGIRFAPGVGGVDPLCDAPVLPEVDRTLDAGGFDFGLLRDLALFGLSLVRPRSAFCRACSILASWSLSTCSTVSKYMSFSEV